MLKSIKIAAVDAVESTDPCKVMYGRVTGESPLTVRVEDRLVLKEKQLAFLEGSGVLAEGDMVTLLRVQGGQQPKSAVLTRQLPLFEFHYTMLCQAVRKLL